MLVLPSVECRYSRRSTNVHDGDALNVELLEKVNIFEHVSLSSKLVFFFKFLFEFLSPPESLEICRCVFKYVFVFVGESCRIRPSDASAKHAFFEFRIETRPDDTR